jgi:hypothetical protein
MNETVLLLFSSLANLITDVWLVVIPIPTLYNLKLPFKQRFVLIILMSLGLVYPSYPAFFEIQRLM